MVSVSGKFCIFSHKNKQHQRFFQLLPDGQIKDIGGTGQRSWLLRGWIKSWVKIFQLSSKNFSAN